MKCIRKVAQYLNEKKALYTLKVTNASYGSGIKFYGDTVLHLKGCVLIGKNFISRSGIENCIISGRSKIVVRPKATLIIGDNSGISNTTIYCYEKVEIGDNVNIGAGTIIFDTNFHSTEWTDRLDRTKDVANAKTEPIKIGDCVFIGAKCIITKGVEIGARSMIVAGSVVTKNVPSDEVWGGNPAKFVRKIV